jgi:hypothetical protein
VALAVAAVWPSPACARQKETTEKRIARLVEQLGDDSFDRRNEAEGELRKIGEPALGALLKAAGDRDLERRQRACRVLPVICTAKAKRLIDDLASKDERKRESADEELTAALDEKAERFQREAAGGALTSAMKGHRDQAVRERACEVLARAWAPRIKGLIEQLGDDAFEKRVKAEQGLVQMGKPALKQMKEALKHRDLEIRCRCKKAIEKIESAR